jgi:hypothetical protein
MLGAEQREKTISDLDMLLAALGSWLNLKS